MNKYMLWSSVLACNENHTTGHLGATLSLRGREREYLGMGSLSMVSDSGTGSGTGPRTRRRPQSMPLRRADLICE